jgi:hypothetical protein
MNGMHTSVFPLFVTSNAGMLHKPKPNPKPKQVLGPKKQLHERSVKEKNSGHSQGAHERGRRPRTSLIPLPTVTKNKKKGRAVLQGQGWSGVFLVAVAATRSADVPLRATTPNMTRSGWLEARCGI